MLDQRFQPTPEEQADGMIVKNAVQCGVCQGPADRYSNRFQCRNVSGHMADLNTGIFSDCTHPEDNHEGQ